MRKRFIKVTSLALATVLMMNIVACSENEEETQTSTVETTTVITECETTAMPTSEETSEETEAFKLETKVGDTVIFGSYAGKDISWIVLDDKDGKYLLLAENGLASKAMNSEDTDGLTWETCELRTWLNDQFYNDSFTEEEKSIIATVTNTTNGNDEYEIDGGNDTEDNIFLLSVEEVEYYFVKEDERVCFPTSKAISDGCYVFTKSNGGNDAVRWWTRSAGNGPGQFRYIECLGDIPFGTYANNDNITIRPAIWINKE